LDAKFRNGTATAADLAKAEEILNANEAKKSQPKAPVVVPDPVPGVTYALPPVPAGRDSDHVKVPITYRTVFSGPFGFTKHCVYRDGTDRVPPWPDGDIVNCYVHNETGGVLEDITYRFVL
jgi:hypothetical protein